MSLSSWPHLGKSIECVLLVANKNNFPAVNTPVLPLILLLNILVYIDMGNQATDTTTLTFAFTTTTTTRNWEIKITQVECSNPGR